MSHYPPWHINRFPDRDMLMRFIGMGIGHLSCGKAPDSSAGVSAEALESAYEYGDTESSEPNVEKGYEGMGDEINDDGDNNGTSDEESTGGGTDEDDDGVRGDWSDDNEPSW
ncbi:hypothetical protein BDV93DRAFT_511395 [Ceratobasidium sp. AG-I]|nr:hypothetical protein BDV93DRAFT_511395 [Ceratobasidium sp. AG-I]